MEAGWGARWWGWGGLQAVRSVRGCGRGRIVTQPPASAIRTWAERGCPQPQHVRKGVALETRKEARIVGAAAAEDSNTCQANVS